MRQTGNSPDIHPADFLRMAAYWLLWGLPVEALKEAQERLLEILLYYNPQKEQS